MTMLRSLWRARPLSVRSRHPSAMRSPSTMSACARFFSSVAGADGPRIELTPTETKLFDFLLYIQHLYAPTTQLRVAGGWVRDKLRGAESEDIDIVLDNIYGKEFANHITKFQRHRKLPMSSVGVVKANSHKSKHLEVAQVKVEGLMVDFVHLRSEAYSSDSRIPEAQFAAPAEDALRRDTTINALFYNLHTQQVEDFTGQGLQDLQQGIIRTPLEPHQTFLDDPLRVLRVIRFACEFGFQLDGKISDCVLGNDDIREAMKRKVSRERVGIEVKKMLSGSDPARAFALLAEFGLLDIVFHTAGEDGSMDVPLDEKQQALKDLFTWTPELVARGHAHLTHLQESRRSVDNHKISFIESTAAVLAPFLIPHDHVQHLKSGLDTFLKTSKSVEASATWTHDVTEDMIMQVSLDYLYGLTTLRAPFPREDLIELLKTNVKWPKPAAKRVTHIIEAIMSFPRDIDVQSAPANHLKLLLWSLRFHDVLSPAIATLLTELTPAEERDRYVRALETMAERFTQQPSSEADEPKKRAARRVDGKQIRDRLGGTVGPHIATALEVLSVWEFVHPDSSRDQELAFLDRLHPFLV